MEGTPTDLTSIDVKLDALNHRVDLLLDRQRAMGELIDEAGPILSAVMQAGTQRLQEFEDRGYFAFGRSALGVLDRVATSYTPDEVNQLGDAVVGILDTVRNVTQPDVLAVANEATDVLHHANDLKPVGVMGALQKSRDEDVQRGMAVLLEVLRHVGKAAKASTPATGKQKLARHLAPTGRAARLAAAPVKAALTAPSPAAKAPVVTLAVPGFELDSQGFLVDPLTWTRPFAGDMAMQLGLGELTPEHWTVIDYMRTTFIESGSSPNIRKVAKGSGVGTRAVYQLFKKAPGTAAARVAGIPKPVGCI